MTFAENQTVEKVSGYPYIGRVLAAYIANGGERYDVQMDCTLLLEQLEKYLSPEILKELEPLIMNGHGLIHIFSDKQLKLYEPK